MTFMIRDVDKKRSNIASIDVYEIYEDGIFCVFLLIKAAKVINVDAFVTRRPTIDEK